MISPKYLAELIKASQAKQADKVVSLERSEAARVERRAA